MIPKKNSVLLICGVLFLCAASPLPAQYRFPNRPLRNRQTEATANAASRSMYSPAHDEIAMEPAVPSLLVPSHLEQSLTRYYINQYSAPGGLAWLESVMKRGEPYLEFIRKEIEEMNLPRELIYLPVIESAYLASALSRAGASGLWQFMRNSISPFDMVVNDWVDERRDFWKSTQGALRKLEENYRYFGDWPLALAAYNAGLGGVSRAVNRNGVKDYWFLSERRQLPSETIHYVPKLLAAAYILSNPRQFGLSPVWNEDPQWVRVEVDRPVDLTMLANEAGIDADFLRWSNRELLYNITPPSQRYYLKAPASDAGKIANVLARTDLSLTRYYMHTVRSGDTLLALALHYGISVDQIVQTNPGTNARLLRIGQNLMIPALKETGPYVRRVQSGGIDFSGTHIVKSGDTLWSLALALDVDPELLAEANGMSMNDVLSIGRTLKTPIRD